MLNFLFFVFFFLYNTNFFFFFHFLPFFYPSFLRFPSQAISPSQQTVPQPAFTLASSSAVLVCHRAVGAFWRERKTCPESANFPFSGMVKWEQLLKLLIKQTRQIFRTPKSIQVLGSTNHRVLDKLCQVFDDLGSSQSLILAGA